MMRSLIGLLSLLLCTALFGCDKPSAPAGTTPKGGSGAARVVEREELRLVTLSPALGLMLQDLGLEDRVVGTHDFDRALGGSIPRVGSLDGIDYEALLTCAPTHVLIEINGGSPIPARLRTLADEHGWILRRVGSLNTLDDIARTIDDLFLSFVSPPEAPEENVIGFSDPAERFERTMPSESFARSIDDRGPRVRGAGLVLLLGQASPPGAIGPKSFHYQVLTRIGGQHALVTGGMWQELDAEDVQRLSPDGIVLIQPRDPTPDDRFVEPEAPGVPELLQMLGAVGELDIPAIRDGRVALIDDPASLVPAGSSMGAFADSLAAILEAWTAQRTGGERPGTAP